MSSSERREASVVPAMVQILDAGVKSSMLPYDDRCPAVSTKPSPVKVSKKEALQQMLRSKGNMGESSSVLPVSWHGRTPMAGH